MSQHITTEEAKRQLLPGYDVYRYTHLLYHDDLNRDFGVVRLNVEAMKAFTDTVTLTHRHKLAAEQAAVKQWLAQGGHNSGLQFPWGEVSRTGMEYVNYEHLKIASAFELHLKARLLARNYILHEVDKDMAGYEMLAKEQRSRPILKQDLLSIRPYHFDGRLNYLPGIKEGSLKFSWLTDKPAYRAVLGLSEQQINIIRDYRLLRNQIHFPGDILESPNIQAFPKPIVEFLTDFINSEIVVWSNELISKYQMNYRTMVPLE